MIDRCLFRLLLGAVLACVSWPGIGLAAETERVRICPAGAGEERPPDFGRAACRSLALSEVDPQGQHLWLRRTIVLDAAAVDRTAGLLISAKAASRAFVNGVALGGNGRPGDGPEDEVAGRMDVVLPVPPGALRVGENHVELRLSSHHGWLHLALPIHAVALVPFLDAQNEILRRQLPALLPLGAFLLASFYFISMLLRSEHRTPAIWLSTLSLLAALQLLFESARGVYAYAYPLHDLRLIGILACSVLFGLCLVAIAAERFAPPSARRWLAGGAVLATCVAAASVSGMDAKAGTTLLLGTLVAAGIAAHGLIRRRPHAGTHLLALLLFAACIVLTRELFLDLYFYYLVAALLVFLMVQQAGAHAREMQRQRELRARADRLQAALDAHAQAQEERVLSVPSVGRLRRVPASSIAHVQGAGDYAELHLIDGEMVLHSTGLNALETELPSYFLRVHRSHIVNTRLVERLQQTESGSGTLHLQNGRTVPVSRRIMPGVRRALQ